MSGGVKTARAGTTSASTERQQALAVAWPLQVTALAWHREETSPALQGFLAVARQVVKLRAKGAPDTEPAVN